jgi:hypothetical protein
VKLITPPEVATSVPVIAPFNAVPADPRVPPDAVSVRLLAVIKEDESVIDPLLVAARVTALLPALIAPRVYDPAFVKLITPPEVAMSLPVMAPFSAVPAEPRVPPEAVSVKLLAVMSEEASVIFPLLVAANVTALLPALIAPIVYEPAFVKLMTPPEVATSLPVMAPFKAVPADPKVPLLAVSVRLLAVIKEDESVIDPLLVAASVTVLLPALIAPIVYEPALVKLMTPPEVATSLPVMAPFSAVPAEPSVPPLAVKVKLLAVIKEDESVIFPLLVAARVTALAPALIAPIVYEPAFVKLITPPEVATSVPVIAPLSAVPADPKVPLLAVNVKLPAVMSEVLSVMFPVLDVKLTALLDAFKVPTANPLPVSVNVSAVPKVPDVLNTGVPAVL